MHYVREAIRLIASYRRNNALIGFCNGCFDNLHAGHIKLLERGVIASDVLIVAMNSDDYIRRVKGPIRPIFDYDARAMAIARAITPRMALMIIELQDNTPLNLIKQLEPDVLIKGAEYSDCDEVKHMLSIKKPIIWVDRTPNISSSSVKVVK